MLFLPKKTMVCAVALGTLLSVAPKAHADLKQASACALASLALYEGFREVDQTQKDKHVLLKAHDTGASYWQSILNAVVSKKGVSALVGALAVYAAVKHGTNVVNAPILQTAFAQITPPTRGK